MGRIRASGNRLKAFAGASALALVVTGCEDGALGNRPGGAATAAADRPAATRLVEREVEAPEVFEAEEAALWDGRPSLGGVWVAHPEVTDPERVIIRNQGNGKFVVGALFRRERENPGPRFQVSSDAAAALGLLAGQPTELSVTALRRKPVAPEPPAPEAEEAAATVPDEPAAEPAEARTAEARTAEARTAEEGPPATGETAAEARPERAPAGERRGFFARLFGGGGGDGGRPEAPTAERRAAAAVVPPDVETAPLEPQPAAATAPATPRPAPALDRAYVQIGIFSVEANAERTAERMRDSGIVPTIQAEESQGTDLWRVVVGPAADAADRRALLAKVKGMGFADAYAVTD